MEGVAKQVPTKSSILKVWLRIASKEVVLLLSALSSRVMSAGTLLVAAHQMLPDFMKELNMGGRGNGGIFEEAVSSHGQ